MDLTTEHSLPCAVDNTEPHEGWGKRQREREKEKEREREWGWGVGERGVEKAREGEISCGEVIVHRSLSVYLSVCICERECVLWKGGWKRKKICDAEVRFRCVFSMCGWVCVCVCVCTLSTLNERQKSV